MKKLMIAAAIVCAAAFAQAATVTWSSAVLYTPANADGGFSETKLGNGKGSGELFTLTKAQYDTFLEAYGKSGDMSAVWDAYQKGDLGTAATSGAANRNGIISLATDASVGSDVYAALIYTYTDATYGDMYIANIATGNVGSDAGITISNLGTYFLGQSEGGTATGGWNAVPEPTSGLLLLLGVAGLALRRRRA